MTAAAQVCPLDPAWRAYYAETLRRYAAEDVDAVWIEDDIRLHNHRPLDWGGCFCELHLAEFTRRTGIATTLEELVAACTAPGEPHAWRGRWLDCWDATQRELLTSWRDILGGRLGLMSSRIDQHAAEGRDWSAWLELPGLHRPHFWAYSDTGGTELPYASIQFDMQRSVQPDAVRILPEIECWPYGQWNKSFRQTAAQMSLAHVLGCDGLAISLYDFLGNHPDDEPHTRGTPSGGTRGEHRARSTRACDGPRPDPPQKRPRRPHRGRPVARAHGGPRTDEPAASCSAQCRPRLDLRRVPCTSHGPSLVGDTSTHR
ncbi:hypothetical protein [Streptomyces poriferorum]|uniref:Glycosyl hydrolase-like 10 domain-containing protein n=1 Tax=Streptomyces poriferorum TaxID=2798799 RepID=A0ABY9IHD2_9ACTN|nr:MULTISPECIES: hypothetical protein [unclassified Streptomyces]MDP5316155.1 hypothetical protein [Streptomyces sp. Alt4]WLQ54490.1 hypothetical protein P8A19_03090 [Streptomyces sp. Alt2]